MPASKTIGVIGAGKVVFNAHLPVLKTMGCEVSWILDASKPRALAVADAYKIPTALGLHELEKSSPTDVVLLASPYGSRKPYYEFLRGRDEAIYIEKPIARTIRELEEICDLRPEYAIAAGFNRRSMGVTNIVKGLIDDGIFGKLRRVRTEFGSATSISTRAGFAKDIALAGGGQLFESAIHSIDAICYMGNIQEAIVQVCNMEQENNFDLHTHARLLLVEKGGTEVEMELLVTCFRNTQDDIEMHFDNAIVTFSLFRKTLPQIQKGTSERVYHIVDRALRDYPHDVFDITHVFWTDFLTGLDASRPNYTNASSASVTTSIIEQLYRFGAQGTETSNAPDRRVGSSTS